MNIIMERQSVRKFLDKEVEDKKIINLLKAGMQALSAHNMQPWEFLVISKKEDIEAISKMSPYAKFAIKTNKIIVVMVNTEGLKTIDWFSQDLSACTENILLQAVEEDLGACWMGFYPAMDRVNLLKEKFNVPEHVIPFSVIAIGYPEEKREFRSYLMKVKNLLHIPLLLLQYK